MPDKESFRKWCVDPGTQHRFYSAFEGVDPQIRVSKANPAVKLHGFVADYDDPNIDAALLASVPGAGVPGLLPTWSCRTFSPGKARLVWEFEEAIWVPEPRMLKKFFLVMGRETKLQTLLPALDPASFDPKQYFEAGDDWKPVVGGAPIPADVLGLWMFEAASSVKISFDGPEIPIELIAEEVEARWPGRWPGNFALGSRGPLFWVEPFIGRTGCQVGDKGMVCYSDRAGSGFVPWAELLGRDFVRKYEADKIGAFLENLWYDGKIYWWRTNEGWRGRGKEDSIMHLKHNGISAKTGLKDTISEAERVLVAVQASRTIDIAAPVLFDNREVVEINGERYLNIGRREAMAESEEPGAGDPKNFPWLHEYFENIWDDADPLHKQRDYFLAWFKRLWWSARSHRVAQGQILVLAGGVGLGKTFLNKWLIGHAMGGSVDASDYLQGKGNGFNKQAAEVGVWRVDDSTMLSTRTDVTRFGDTLKRQAANPTVLYHPKFRDAIEMPWSGRIVLTCNTDPDSLAIIPAQDNSVADKTMMLKFTDTWIPKFGSNHENEQRVVLELPYFLAWLRDWVPPGYVVSGNNRYGVVPYKHPELFSIAGEASSAYSTKELLHMWGELWLSVNPNETTRSLSVSEIMGEIRANVPGGADMLRGKNPIHLGRDLRKLLGVWPPLVSVVNHSGISRYKFDLLKIGRD